MKSAAERLREVLCHVFAWLLFLLCLPFLILIFSAFFVWKNSVIQVTKFFKTKLTLIFSSYDGLLAVEPFWETSRSNLALILVVDASINIDKFRDSFTEEILQPKSQILDSNGKPLFEKLLQIPITFGGYYFWSKANYFLIHEHIRLVEQPMTSTQLKKFAGTVMNLPFPNKRPLWEILVFPNYISDADEKDNEDSCVQSVVVLRVHHAVADSWALMNLLHCMLTGRQTENSVGGIGALTENHSFSSFPITKKINFVLKLPLRVIKFYIDLHSHEDWFTTKHLESEEGFVSWTRIPHDTIRKIGNTASLGESSLSLTLFSGAFGKYISELQRNCPTLNKDGSDSKRDEAPEIVRVCLPLTWMSISCKDNKSTNWKTATNAKFPLRKTLYGNNGPNITSISTTVSASINSGLPQLISLYIYLLGLFPRHFLRYIMTWNNLGTNLIFQENPSFPTVSEMKEDQILLWGHKVEEIIPIFGFQWRQTALTVTTLKFKGDTVMTFMSNADIMSGYQSTLDRVVQELLQKDLESILQEIQDENGFISIPI